MRFDVNRLSTLAGLPASSSSRRSSRNLNEASNRSLHDDPSVAVEAEYRYGKNQLSEQDEYENENLDNLEEEKEADEGAEPVYEIDEADLVSELRRLRVMTKINSTKKRQQKQKALQEAQLRQIIEEEVDNVFKDLENGNLDLNISGDWVYGKNKPKNSRRGRIARGFKSIGFK
jgi:hypothetical protein